VRKLRLFWFAPLVGGVAAGTLYRWLGAARGVEPAERVAAPEDRAAPAGPRLRPPAPVRP
jgi:hypothetical protein